MKIHRLTETVGFQTAINNETHFSTTLLGTQLADVKLGHGDDIVELNAITAEQVEIMRDLLTHTLDRMEYLNDKNN